MPSKEDVIEAWAPAPIAIIAMTAPTPITIPNIVSAERPLLASRLTCASLKDCRIFMRLLLPADHLECGRSAGSAQRFRSRV